MTSQHATRKLLPRLTQHVIPIAKHPSSRDYYQLPPVINRCLYRHLTWRFFRNSATKQWKKFSDEAMEALDRIIPSTHRQQRAGKCDVESGFARTWHPTHCCHNLVGGGNPLASPHAVVARTRPSWGLHGRIKANLATLSIPLLFAWTSSVRIRIARRFTLHLHTLELTLLSAHGSHMENHH